MRITGVGTFPVSQIAKSYGLKAPAPAGALKFPKPVDATQSLAPPGAMQSSARVQQLVAAKVSQPVTFDSPSVTPLNHSPVLQMYTRAADKIEAAVGVQLGRTLDVQA